MPNGRKKQRMCLKTGILVLSVILACFCCSCGNKEESVPQKDAPSNLVESIGGSGQENEENEKPSADDNELPIITDPDLG